MNRIPLVPLILGLTGLIPFVWGATTLWLPDLQAWAAAIWAQGSSVPMYSFSMAQ